MAIQWSKLNIYSSELLGLLPLCGYIIFGIGNIIFFSMSMKVFSASTAYAVWTGLSLILAKVVDSFIFSDALSFKQILFMLLILAGVIGLKFTE